MNDTSEPFKPPFCPRARCPFHLNAFGWRWIHWGFYRRRCEPQIIQRFRCKQCGSRFSTQSFSTTYYLKRPELQIKFFHSVLACSGYRQIAREARCNPTTVMGQVARLGRHALLALRHLRTTPEVHEPIVIDGFESFAFSQYHPLHLNLAVGARSHYIYGFTHSELRRKGRMSARQKKVRDSLERTFGKPDPKAIESGIVELLKLAAPNTRDLTVRSDEHPAYPRALRRLGDWRIRHECTPSIAARTWRNPLYPVNALDLLFRHNSANHKRETIAFSKRNQSVVERAAVLALWRNFSKQYSENHGGGTPAMRIGMRELPIPIAVLFKERLFPTRIRLPRPWTEYYWRNLPTRRIKSPRVHCLALAF